MSGLEKFEASESWRLNLKKFIFIERKPTFKKPQGSTEVHRCSLDIAEDLQSLIKERKQQIELEKQQKLNSVDTEANREKNKMSQRTPHSDDKCYEQLKDLPLVDMISDESFEALEKMCDKTASDPNSTLFQYLNSDEQDQVLADVKKRNSEEGHVVDQLMTKFNDCTVLEEIEAPSRIWENTMIVETVLTKTSPVKMIGLLRPSTIMEEGGDDSVNSDISTEMSYKTASKRFPSDVSSTYDTAIESNVTSTGTDDVSNKCSNEEEIDVDDILEKGIQKSLQLAIDKAYDLESFKGIEITNEKDESTNLIDLEKTCDQRQISPETSMHKYAGDIVIDDDECDAQDKNDQQDEGEEEGEDSVICILSDEDDKEESDDEEKGKRYASEFQHNKERHFASKSDVYGFSTDTFEENKENRTHDSISSDKSMKFNDTIEEVEYMLRKGLEYMAIQDLRSVQTEAKCYDTAPKAESLLDLPILENQRKPTYPIKLQQMPKAQLKTCRTQPNTPVSRMRTPINATTSLKKDVKTHATSLQTSANKHLTQIGMRPFPKFGICGGTPRNGAAHPRHKELSAKQPFAHIVSPVGAYMKKTATTPLMSSGEMKNRNVNDMKSKAFRELENESRLYETKFDTNSTSTRCRPGISVLPGITCTPETLPKKAYISSELKHIVDERTPITIPGGKKIQKYLENTMMPAVLRHDGKMKFPGAPKVPNKIQHHTFTHPMNVNNSQPSNDALVPTEAMASRRKDASLADLSVMSGDVSMYTIMDAQKF